MTAWVPTVRIAPEPEESLRGFLIRACETNGWPSLPSFLLPTVTSSIAFKRGVEIEKMAAALGIGYEMLAAVAAVHTRLGVGIRGHWLPLNRVRTTHRCICLRCLSEARYQRFWWDIEDVTICHRHSILLERRCQCGALLSWSDPALDKCRDCAGNLCRLTVEEAPAPEHRFQGWLLGRFGVIPPNPHPLLDDLPVAVATEFVEMIALMASNALGGRHPKPFLGLDGAPDRNREAGFANCTEAAITALTIGLGDAYRERTGRAAPSRPAEIFEEYEGFVTANLCGKGHALESVLLGALPLALGFPVERWDRVDYRWIAQVAWDLRCTVQELLAELERTGLIRECVGPRDRIFVPTEIAYEMIAGVRKRPPRQ